jgi:hypothetical protein
MKREFHGKVTNVKKDTTGYIVTIQNSFNVSIGHDELPRAPEEGDRLIITKKPKTGRRVYKIRN